VEDVHTQSNNQLMTLKTELPTNSLLPLTTIQQQTQNILPTRIYRHLKYIANDNKLSTTISVSEENFSLAEKIKSVSVHLEDKMYQYILSQNQHPPAATQAERLELTRAMQATQSIWVGSSAGAAAYAPSQPKPLRRHHPTDIPLPLLHRSANANALTSQSQLPPPRHRPPNNAAALQTRCHFLCAMGWEYLLGKAGGYTFFSEIGIDTTLHTYRKFDSWYQSDSLESERKKMDTGTLFWKYNQCRISTKESIHPYRGNKTFSPQNVMLRVFLVIFSLRRGDLNPFGHLT
jgi:hypothetical protein